MPDNYFAAKNTWNDGARDEVINVDVNGVKYIGRRMNIYIYIYIWYYITQIYVNQCSC